MQTKLIKNNSENLIIFLSGWACDDEQFSFLTENSSYDILICYNYSDLSLDFDFSGYKKFYLITFSAGVFIAGMIKNILPEFEKTIAINGNPLAYDEYFGLRTEVINLFNGVDKTNAIDFRRKYLVYNDKELSMLNKCQPKRTFEDCRIELLALNRYAQQKPEPYSFDTALLSDNDKIFIPERQLEYWRGKSICVILKNSAHFPFFRFKNFDEILEL